MMHEDRREETDATMGSEKSFGIVFTVVFAVIAVVPVFYGELPRLWAIGVAAAFLALALLFPSGLKPLNVVWFKLGLLLHKLVTPLTLGFMFFVVLMPIGLLMRLMGKDPLHLKMAPPGDSYWRVRGAGEPSGSSMKNQY